MKRHFCLVLPLAALLGACTAGADYVPPAWDIPATYKEQGIAWTPIDTKQDAPAAWWRCYADPVLDDLMKQLDAANPTLDAARATYRAALATLDETDAGLFPSLTLDASSIRAGRGNGKSDAQTTHEGTAMLAWDPDLWGRLTRASEADAARADAAAADLAAARLSLQAALASAYFQMRAADSMLDLLRATADAYDRLARTAQDKYQAGLTGRADWSSARSAAESARADVAQTAASRAGYEHVIAALLGRVPAAFALAPAPLPAVVPSVPAFVPSVLLQARPDIVAAERLLAASHAEIGVQQAAYFPNLTLSASYGTTASALSKLMQAPNSVWTFGPALAATLFDGGARAARVDRARAQYDAALGTYRATVLTAFQEVEDALGNLRHLAEAAAPADAAHAAAKDAEAITLNQYSAGLVPYTDVATAALARLNAAEKLLNLQEKRFLASVALAKSGLPGGKAP